MQYSLRCLLPPRHASSAAEAWFLVTWCGSPASCLANVIVHLGASTMVPHTRNNLHFTLVLGLHVIVALFVIVCMGDNDFCFTGT